MEAACCIRDGWLINRPEDTLRILPICDGGDGFGETLAELENAKPILCQTVNAAHQPITASWWWQEQQKMAIIESACIIGLAQLPPSKYHPFELDTFGLGTVLNDIVKRGAETCVMGIGGSATNDGGFGMAKALGWRFLAKDHEEITKWTELDRLSIISPPERTHLLKNLVIASDVENLLLGAEGASRIYGPQKGLLPKDMHKSETCLKSLSEQVDAHTKHGWRFEPGSGAAGGLGYGLMAFLGGKAESGFDYFARRADLDSQLEWANLVITGEGSLDLSTLMGKGVGSVAKKSKEMGKACVGIAGVAKNKDKLSSLFTNIYQITPNLADQESALQFASKWLKELAKNASKDIHL
jgi:glycerate kinase